MASLEGVYCHKIKLIKKTQLYKGYINKLKNVLVMMK